MLDLNFAAQVMAKLQARFQRSCILLGLVMSVVAVTAGLFHYIFQQQLQRVQDQIKALNPDATYQEIEEVRATVVNFGKAYRQSEEKGKFKNIARSLAALQRDLALLRRAGERAVLDGQKLANQNDDLTAYLKNAQRVMLVFLFLGIGGLALTLWRTWRRFNWSIAYYQALQERQVVAEQVLASAPAAGDPPPPLPEISPEAEDELDLAKILMKGVRRLRQQKQAFAGQHVAHLDLPAAAPAGPAYLRKAVRFKTPLAVLITDPADLPQAQQVMNYSATGILIRIPHQPTPWPRPGQLIQGRLGTAKKFSTFSGTVVRIEQRPHGDLIGVRFVTAPW